MSAVAKGRHLPAAAVGHGLQGHSQRPLLQIGSQAAAAAAAAAMRTALPRCQLPTAGPRQACREG
eukprot:1161693-Pelagomonas_calceolata.AAC.2